MVFGSDRGQDRVDVVAVVDERNCFRHGPELQRVDHVARERRPAADHLVAGIERRLRDAVDQPVRARSDRNLLEADAVAVGKGGAQQVGAPVRVAVRLTGGALDGLERGRKRRERALVRGELDHSLEPELALNLLDGLPRLVGPDARRARGE